MIEEDKDIFLATIMFFIIIIMLFFTYSIPAKIMYSISQRVCVYDNNKLIYDGKRYNITVNSAGTSTEYLRESTYLRIDKDYRVSTKIVINNCEE
jgi:hypothetical protein